MTAWSQPFLTVYNPNGSQRFRTDVLIEASGSEAWHEVGRTHYVIVPYTSSAQVTGDYAPGNRVAVTVWSDRHLTNVRVCDFIVESVKVEEFPLETGGVSYAVRAEGRPLVKELTHFAVDRRCISRRGDSAENAAAVTKNTLTMGATDKASSLNTGQSLVGWTVELADGAWSQIVAHDQAAGTFTIEPEWSTYQAASGSTPESGIPPAAQKWQVYGVLTTNTDPNSPNTDLKQIVSFAPEWQLHPVTSMKSTGNGTFLAPNGANVFRTLVAAAQQSGEYFRADPAERRLNWFSGLGYVQHPNYAKNLVVSLTVRDSDTTIAARPLPGATMQLDDYEYVSRVKPTGDGSGDQQLTLKDLPAGFSVATNYAVDGEYLVYVPSDNNRRVEREVAFPLIGQANDGAASKARAAQALYDAALVWLKEHQGPRRLIQVEVDSPIPIYTPAKLYALFPEFVANTNTYYILDATCIYKDGEVRYRLTLSDKRVPDMDDARLVAEALVVTGGGGGSGRGNATSSPARNSRRIDKTTVVVEGGGEGGTTDHGLLTGLLDNDHPQYTLGTDFATHVANANAHHAAATAGDATIAVTGQAVRVNLAGSSGLTGTAGLALADTVAGQGLVISNKVINVTAPADSGMVITGDSISLGTPGTLAAATTNALSGSSHTHAITNTSNAKTTPNTILRGDTNGDVTLRFGTMDRAVTPVVESAAGLLLDPASGTVQVDGNVRFTGARSITSDTGAVSLAPAAGLVIAPGSNVTTVNPTVTLQTSHYNSGFGGDGWQVQYNGAAEFRKLTADELHVQAFIADTARVKVGEEWITPSMALVSRTFTVPGVNSSGTLFIEDAPGLEEMPLFGDGEWVMLRIVDRAGGGLRVASVWGQVTNYSNLADGEQSWTFTTRYSGLAISGFKAQRGSVALCYGKSGDGYIRSTTLDAAGAPYVGVSRWTGANPYAEGNRQHLVRLGNLKGMSGVTEWGLRAGFTSSRYVHFSDTRSEIHNARLSLYAGNGASLRVGSVLVQVNTTVLRPNADHDSYNIESSAAANYYTTIDETTNSYGDYVANAPNGNAYIWVGLTNPSFASLSSVSLRAYTRGVGFATSGTIDTIRLYAQVFAADEVTALTDEMLVRTATNNTDNDSGLTAFGQFSKTTNATVWAGARLRLRWEYETNVASEVIRLDPAQPSIAVGSPLPTGIADGGDGFWVGRAVDGVYKLRLGAAAGASLRYDGSNLLLRNSAGVDVIRMTNTGASEFAGPMTIGLTGGIWQGTGTFAAPTRGLKIWSQDVSGVAIGRLATYNGGVEQIAIDTLGRLTAGAGAVKLSADGLTLVSNSGLFGGKGDLQITTFTGTRMAALESYYFTNMNETRLRLGVYGTAGATEPPAYIDFDVIGTGGYTTVAGGQTLGLSAAVKVDVTAPVLTVDQGAADDAIFEVRSSDVAHGMTTVALTRTYGFLSKNNPTNGGLNVAGLGAGATGVALRGYGSTRDTTATTSTLGTVTLEGFLKSGTGVTTVDVNGSLVAVKNNGLTRVIIRGNGDILSDSSESVGVYDAYDDVALLRGLSVTLDPAGVVRNEWDRFVSVNRDELQAAGILDGTFVNQTALGRLLTGAVWQLHSRIAELERRVAKK